MDKKKKFNQKNDNPVSKTNMVFNKSFGQHILINQQILTNIVDKSAIRSTDIVLEIGPGTGNLTHLLLQKAKKVIAVEIDPRMIAELTKRFKYSEYSHKFELLQGALFYPYFFPITFRILFIIFLLFCNILHLFIDILLNHASQFFCLLFKI